MTPKATQSSRAKKSAIRSVKPRTAGGALSGILGAVAMSAVAGILITAAVTPLVAVSGAAATSAISIFENLPNHLDPGKLAEPSTIYALDNDDNKVELATFYDQDREMVAWDEISQHVKDAAVAEEDPRFYTHGGVDVLATSRAALQNVAGQGFSGASTVTMQYVRNVLVQEAMSIPDEAARDEAYEDAMRQDIDRKLKEMKLAVSIEKKFSKDEILLGYLNIALFGRQIYGIESAAHYYYGKSAKDVTLAEAASLVAIVNNPGKLQIDIEENIERNKQRRDKILSSMYDVGKITEAQYEEAIATEVEPNITPRVAGCAVAENKGLGHFCNYVQLYIKNDPSFGNTPEERQFNFMRGGYDIVTTIDLDMQQAATEAIQQTVAPNIPGLDAGSASVSVEVGTGNVLAMAQNRPFSDDPKVLETNPDYTSVNYNTDFEYGGSSGFQVGSTAKAWTLAEWLRTGHSVHEMVNGNQRQINSSNIRAHCLPGGVYGYDTWRVGNDGNANYGNIPVMRATASSINAGFVSMQEKMDLCDTMDLAERLGAHRASPQTVEGFNNYGTTDMTRNPVNVYAGTDELAPLTMANVYAAFANEGVTCSAVPIASITDSDGEAVPFTKSKCTEAVSPEVAAGVLYAFQGVVQNGTATYAQSPHGVPHFAKTGTTDDWVDMWLVGGSTEVVTASWIGNVVGKVSTQSVGIQWGLRNIWPSIMNVADVKYGGSAFPEPSSAAIRTTMVEVPDTKGKSVEEAEELLTGVGFTVTDGGETDSAVDDGRVARTDPDAGSSVAVGSSVTIYRSNGSMSDVPDVTGEEGRAAERAITSAGFNPVLRCESGSGNPRQSEIVEMTPSGGSEAKRGSQIVLLADCGDD